MLDIIFGISIPVFVASMSYIVYRIATDYLNATKTE